MREDLSEIITYFFPEVLHEFFVACQLVKCIVERAIRGPVLAS